MICPQCHEDNQDDAAQCAHCGAPLAPEADNDAAAKRDNGAAPYSVISESLEEVRSMGTVPNVLAAERVMGLGAVSDGEEQHLHRNEVLASVLPEPEMPSAKTLADSVPIPVVPSKAELSDKIPVVGDDESESQAAKIKDSGSIPAIYDEPAGHGSRHREQAHGQGNAGAGNPSTPSSSAVDEKASGAYNGIQGASVAEEAAELFEGSALADLTAPVLDFSGLETIVDSSYVPPVPNRTGDTMEIPVIKDEERAGRSRQFMGVDDPKLDKQRSKEQKKIDRALAKEKKKASRAAKKAAAGAGVAAGAVAVGAAAATTAQAAEAGDAARGAAASVATVSSGASAGRSSQASKGANTEKNSHDSSAHTSERETASPYSGAPEAAKRGGVKEAGSAAKTDSSCNVGAKVVAPSAASGESSTYAGNAPSHEDDGAAGKSAKGKGKLVAVIVILVAVALAAVVGVTYYLEIWGGKTVPNVVGSPAAQAQAVLEEAGFTVGLEQQKSDSEEGLVLSQSPDGVRAEEGSAVTLVVAQSRIVPDVKGQAVDAALAALSAEGYTDVAQTEQKSNEAQGTVLAVSPEAGTKAPSTQQITLTVAVPFTVPDVAGQSGSDAQAALEAEGYEVVVEYEYDDDVPQGDALSTDPEAGTQLNSGSTVTLYLAKSRAAECVAYAQAYFNSTDKFIIGGSSYRIDPAKLSIEYIGDDTIRYTVAAIEYGTIFGIVVENNAAGWQNLTGIIRWDMAGNNIASDPEIRRA